MFSLGTKSLLTAAFIAAVGLFGGKADASTVWTLEAFGITYTLTGTAVDSTTMDFTLDITGINGASDTEGDRYGVNAFSFSDPYANTVPTSITAPSGFTASSGGLNSSGCNGTGSFFCFTNNTTPNTVMAADSSLSYSFTISTAPDIFPEDYVPHLKIDWVGEKNNYDLVSLDMPMTTVPVPSTLPLMGSGLALAGLLAARRKRRAVA